MGGWIAIAGLLILGVILVWEVGNEIYRAGVRKGFARGYTQAEYERDVLGRFYVTENRDELIRRSR